ncbi:MAG TPA: HI0074 family nucleotidyltransferase substrate-binding subunit, partial [Chlamydiales bacterium]|nr:HI0074 family nucleotidyltransferase substrate-binding subunit [Chlamydiales bacterium]
KRFEFCFESFWKVLKRYLSQEGIDAISPREVLEKAYQLNWIDDESVWLEMLRDRKQTAHVYDEEEAEKVFQHVRNFYYPVMKRSYDALEKKFLSAP